MPTQLPAVVVCPSCHGALRVEGEAAVECASCGARFAIVEGVIDFLSRSEHKDDRDERHGK